MLYRSPRLNRKTSVVSGWAALYSVRGPTLKTGGDGGFEGGVWAYATENGSNRNNNFKAFFGHTISLQI